MALKDVSYLSISWTRCKLLEDRNYICFIAFVPKACHSPWLIANAQWVIVESMKERRKKWMGKMNEILTSQLSITIVHTYIRIQDKCIVYILWTHLHFERKYSSPFYFYLRHSVNAAAAAPADGQSHYKTLLCGKSQCWYQNRVNMLKGGRFFHCLHQNTKPCLLNMALKETRPSEPEEVHDQ